MVNMNGEDVNLGLGLGSTNYSIQTRMINSSPGAGVNATGSRVDMAFAASDPLSELVWSPHNGLSLRCANSSLANKKPILLWNVELSSNKGLSPLQSVRSNGCGDDKCVDADGAFGDKGSLIRPSTRGSAAELGANNADCDDGKSNHIIKEGSGIKYDIQNVQIANTVIMSKENAEMSTSEKGANNCKVELMNLDVANHSDAGRGNMNNNIGMHFPIPAPPLNKLESSAEKGKEKALSEGDICMRASDRDKGNSHESVESCNSTGVFPKGVKRQMYDQELILGSKRMKSLTSVIWPNSLFMSWMSTIVKGLSDCNKESTLACSHDVYDKNLQENYAGLESGFQAVFQSMYCRNASISHTGAQKENDSMNKSREFMLADGTSSKRNNDNSCKEIVVAKNEVNPISHVGSQYACESDLVEKKAPEIPECNNITAEDAALDMPLAVSDLPEKSDLLTSFWISRLSTKTQETMNSSTYCLKANLDNRADDTFLIDQKIDDSEKELQRITAHTKGSVALKSTSKLHPIMPSEKFTSSETMASVFARRLDALRHIIPSERQKNSLCFFCGSGHDLRGCPDVTETELEDLLVKMSSFERIEELPPCFCIRCFQLDHWAVLCPLAPLNDVKENKMFPMCNIVAAQDKAAPLDIFHAIRNLRLSRSDILRWMNSNVSLSHLNGFFLRLRGKMETALGGSSYYVACITGDAKEHIGYDESKKSILVDVGGIKSFVGSQYVSNHDFLEDEIKAWWCRIVNSGCKIPSIDELNSMLNNRKKLGF